MRELAAAGIDELQDRFLWPLEAQANQLAQDRALAVRRLIRARSEQAGAAYRAALAATAQAFALVQAYGETLEALERPDTSRADLAGGRQSFDYFKGREIGPFPASPALQAFEGCGFNVSMSLDTKAARDRVAAALASSGIQL